MAVLRRVPLRMCSTALVLSAAARGASAVLYSVPDHSMLQEGIAVSVSVREHQGPEENADDHVGECVDQPVEAKVQLAAEGLHISSCHDRQVPVNCDHETYGPLLKQLCPHQCNSCFLVNECAEDDLAAQHVLRRANVNVTGCQDPMVSPFCQNTSEYGSHIRTLCRATCEVDGCTTTDEMEDDDTARQFPPNAGAHDDPHVINLAGEKFNINQPARRHLLLRVPPDPRLTALIEFRATVAAAEPDGRGACSLYMQRMAISGKWIGEEEVEVQPLRRNQYGSNGAGNATLENFSVRESRGAAWKSFAQVSALQDSALVVSPKVSVEARRREQYGRQVEAQSFVFRVSPRSGPPAEITVSQAPHQALNIDMAHMANLGMSSLGGLLGTERHDPEVERRTDACRQALAVEALRKQGDTAATRDANPSGRYSTHQSAGQLIGRSTKRQMHMRRPVRRRKKSNEWAAKW